MVMKFNEIIDPLYGKIRFPAFINRLLFECPEILRLKEVRMSNINFFNFPGFSDSTRYEHSIGTAYLALKLSEELNLSKKDKYEFVIAALCHDVATPSFGHVTESIYKEKFGFDHEEETAKIILGRTSDFRKTYIEPIFAGEGPRVRQLVESLKEPSLDIQNIFNYILGHSKYGKAIKGDMDLDNIDNVIRSAFHIGLEVDRELPVNLALGFRIREDGQMGFNYEKSYLIRKWLNARYRLYTHLLLNIRDFNRETMLKYALKKAANLGVLKEMHWKYTDNELISILTNPQFQKINLSQVSELIGRIRLGNLLKELGLYWIWDEYFYETARSDPSLLQEIEEEIYKLLKMEIFVHIALDKRSRGIRNFWLITDGPLFPPKIGTFGEEPKNLLLGIFTTRKIVVKRGANGKPILDDSDTKRQQQYKQEELNNLILQALRKYLKSPKSIRVFSPQIVERGKDNIDRCNQGTRENRLGF